MPRFRLRYTAYLAGLIALIVLGTRKGTTPATPPPSKEVRESAARIPVTGGPEGASAIVAEIRRHGRPHPPATAEPRPKPIAAPRRGTSVKPKADSIAALLREMDLTPEQIRRLRALADEKEQEARKLQDKVYEIHMSVPQVSKRIDEIQSAFEAKVAKVLSRDQMKMFYALKDKRKIGTPAIMVPSSAAGQ